MLETIREFAADRLEQRPEVSAGARLAHATYFADLAQRLRGELTGNHRDTALAAMLADVGNMRIAWAHWVAAGDIGQLDKLADSLLILNDARGWYLDTVGLTSGMLAVLGASPSTPDRVGQEIALRISLARALMATKGFTEEVEEAFAGAVELFERGADVGQQFQVLRGLASLYQLRGQVEKAADLGREILVLGEREHDPRMLIDGHLVIAAYLVFGDDLQGGLDHLDQAIALFAGRAIQPGTRRVGNDPRVACYTTSALALWLAGKPDRAVERANAAMALAVELEHPFTSAFARFHSGLLHSWRREWDIVLDRAVGLLEIADEHDLRIWTAVGTCLLGAAQVGLGRFDEGLANIRTGMGLYQGFRSPPIFWPILLLVDAGASHRAGRPADSLPALEAARGMLASTVLLPEIHILKGDVLAALAPHGGSGDSDAESWYRMAYDRSGELGARMTQLRAATRLAHALQARGEHAAAARILGPVYATFTEGFATSHLVEARDLLASITPGESRPA